MNAGAASADGLVNNDPEHALTDGAQSITPKSGKKRCAH
jgi:3-deoxy-D-arabino-heptulosonate 7-phosphate (DAHP) synthase